MLIWGAGGHGRVVRDVLIASGADVVGFVDRARRAEDLPSVGHPIVLEAAVSNEGPLPLGATALAAGVGENAQRLRLLVANSSRTWVSVVHPSAVVGSHVTIGAGTVLMAHAVVNAGASLGRAVIVNTGAVVEHDCQVGDGAHVSPGAVLCGGVVIGKLGWVGAGAVVLPGIHVGEGAVVGAGATVVRHVAAGATVVGTPARVLTNQSQYGEPE